MIKKKKEEKAIEIAGWLMNRKHPLKSNLKWHERIKNHLLKREEFLSFNNKQVNEFMRMEHSEIRSRYNGYRFESIREIIAEYWYDMIDTKSITSTTPISSMKNNLNR